MSLSLELWDLNLCHIRPEIQEEYFISLVTTLQKRFRGDIAASDQLNEGTASWQQIILLSKTVSVTSGMCGPKQWRKSCVPDLYMHVQYNSLKELKRGKSYCLSAPKTFLKPVPNQSIKIKSDAVLFSGNTFPFIWRVCLLPCVVC